MAAPLSIGEFAGEREANAMLCIVQSERGREEGRFPEPIWWIPGCSGVDCRLDKGNPKIAEGLQTLSWVLPSFARVGCGGAASIDFCCIEVFFASAIRRLKNPVPINDLLRDAASSLGEAVERRREVFTQSARGDQNAFCHPCLSAQL